MGNSIQIAGSARTAHWRILLVTVACALTLVPSETATQATPSGPSILLITIDTLRADRLGSYGYATATTPVLDSLAASGTRFSDATAHATLTHPSHGAILTGRYQGSFGIRLNGMDPLPAEATTLAERMKSAGYGTAAVVGSVVLDKAHGLGQGFDAYDDEIARPASGTIAMASLQRTASEVTAAAKAWLREHGEPDHGFFLYDATLHVPLIMAGPGIKPSVVKEQVRSIDIAPTIARLAGAASDAHPAAGESLTVLLEGGSRPEIPVSIAESWYPRLHFGWSELRSARVGEWKYIAAPKPEVYDLRVDRGESSNLVSSRAQVAARLDADVRRITTTFGRSQSASPPAQPDAETVARLQALGYVGSFAPVTASSSSENPKDHIADYRQYRELFDRALGHLESGKPAAAVPVLQQILKSNVRAFEAHLHLGHAYFELGRMDAALAEYDAAAQLNPTLSTPHFEAAKTFAVRGDTPAAVARARRGLQVDPDSSYGHYTLGVVYQRAAQWREAYIAFGRAVELNGRDPRARANFAGAAMRLDSLAVAHTQFEAMIALGYQVAPAHFNLGVIAERRGNKEVARTHDQQALRSDPTFKPARAALRS